MKWLSLKGFASSMSFVFYSWKNKPHCSKLGTAERLFCFTCKANIVLGIHMCVRVLFQEQLRPELTVAACFWLDPTPHQTKANYLFEKQICINRNGVCINRNGVCINRNWHWMLLFLSKKKQPHHFVQGNQTWEFQIQTLKTDFERVS